MPNNKITAKLLRKAIKTLRKYKVKEPYYVQVDNPKEGGDLLFRRITKKGETNARQIN